MGITHQLRSNGHRHRGRSSIAQFEQIIACHGALHSSVGDQPVIVCMCCGLSRAHMPHRKGIPSSTVKACSSMLEHVTSSIHIPKMFLLH
jgi:hypothetical protein